LRDTPVFEEDDEDDEEGNDIDVKIDLRRAKN
jgi:hypothetical protein